MTDFISWLPLTLTATLLLLALGIEVNSDFLRSAKLKDVGSSLAVDEKFFACYFGFMGLFPHIFEMSPKGPPFIFFLFCNRMDARKIPKGPLSHISALYDLPETSKNRFFSSFGYCRREFLTP